MMETVKTNSADLCYAESTIAKLERAAAYPHSLVMTGNVGKGGIKAAMYLAKAWLGTDVPAAHPDFMLLDPVGAVIQKEDADAVREMAKLSPGARYNVFLINNADRLTVSAQNSMLKLLEDGEKKNKVIFIGGDDLIPTIKSRCFLIECVSKPYEDFLGGTADRVAYEATKGILDEYEELMADEEMYALIRRVPGCFTGKEDPLKVFGLEKDKSPNSFWDNADAKRKQWLLNAIVAGIDFKIKSWAADGCCPKEFSEYLNIPDQRAGEILMLTVHTIWPSATTNDFFVYVVNAMKGGN